MVALARKGGGYVHYLWPRRRGHRSGPAEDHLREAVPGAGWVIGTGVDVHHIDTAFSAAALRFALVAVVIAPLVIIGLWVIRGLTRALGGEPVYVGPL